MIEAAQGENEYAVLWPLGRRAATTSAPAPRHEDLAGKTVCELWDLMFRGEEIYPLIRQELKKLYPGIRFVDHSFFGNIHGASQNDLVAALPQMLRQHGCDAVIAGIGA